MTKIKICGIKTLPDALAAIDAGADLLGFNFYPKSPRYINPETCREITAVLRRQHPQIALIGVFVNSPVDEIRATHEACSLHLAQLHGDETPETLAALRVHAFKAIRLPAAASVFIRESANESVIRPALLVDAAVQGVYGGSGVVADWSATAELARRIPLLLAGGLTPENVSAAVRQVQPWGVDTASGVESSPGVKDTEKMAAFAAAVHSVDSEKRKAVSIHRAEKTDLPEILALQKLAYQSEAELNGDYNLPPLTQSFEQIEIEFGQRIFLKAVLDGQIVGSVRAHLQGDRCQIGRLIVHPDDQGRGIGSRLMNAIEAQFTGRYFELFTSQRSTRNLYLYRKLGYRDFKQERLSERVNLVYLEKINDNYKT